MTDTLTAPADSAGTDYAGTESAVTGQGYAIRSLPLPLYVRAHAAALVPAAHAGESLDLTAADIPVLGTAVAADRAGAALLLAAGAARLRLARAGEKATAGAGASREEAVAQAIYTELAHRVRDKDPIERIRISDCEPAESALRGTGARVICHLLGESASVPVIGARLRLDRLGRTLHAVVCDLDLRRGTRRAVHAVLREFVEATLNRPETDGDRATNRSRATDADRATAAVTDPGTEPGPAADLAGSAEPPESLEPVAVGEIAYTELDTGPAPDAEPALLRAALERSGLRARVRVLSPEDSTTVVVACRITEDTADGPDATSPAPPEVRTPQWPLAPRQLSLTYEPDDVRLSRIFHENSKMRTAFGTLPAVDVNDMAPAARRLIGRAYRDFRDTARTYDLIPQAAPELIPLDRCVRRRRSWAPMGGDALTRDQLAHLLDLSYGTTGSGLAGQDVRLPLRATPSAGGLYSCDLFLLVNRVTGIEPGLYYLHPGRRVLQLVRSDRSWDEVTGQTGYQGRADQAAAMVVYTGAFRRNQWKYRERGYRTVLLDCGHLAQSVVLTATALGLVAHPMIAFVDDYFNDLVGVDGIDDAVLYLTLLGPREAAR
jgi:SagB-type dehydrogenase family enzyme